MQIFYYLYRERIAMTSHERVRTLSSPTFLLPFMIMSSNTCIDSVIRRRLEAEGGTEAASSARYVSAIIDNYFN